MRKSEDYYRHKQQEYRLTHRKEKSKYNKESWRVDHTPDSSIYKKPKIMICSCGRKTVNHYRCPVCLEEMEIPGDCLGWEITANHMF